jgi:hypothetical protein
MNNEVLYEKYTPTYYNKNFYIAVKNGLWGVVDENNNARIPFEYDCIKEVEFYTESLKGYFIVHKEKNKVLLIYKD